MRVGTLVRSKFFVDPDLMPTLFRVFGLRTMLSVARSWLAHRTLVPKPISIPFDGCCVAPRSQHLRGRRGGPCVHHGGKPITAMIELVSLATTAGSFWGKDQLRRSRDASILSGECNGAGRGPPSGPSALILGSVGVGLSDCRVEIPISSKPVWPLSVGPKRSWWMILGTKLSPVRPMRAFFSDSSLDNSERCLSMNPERESPRRCLLGVA